MKFTQIKETCIYSRDLERAEKFYSEILGLEIIGKGEGRHIFFRAGTSVLLIFNPDYTATQSGIPSHDGEGRIHFAFEVEKTDYEGTRAEILAKGVTITHEHNWKGGRSFYFNDPDGHILEIIEGNAIWGG
jgi:catechol 2,3-dioxygenase-like lactoylglutathione lyase family enzyme